MSSKGRPGKGSDKQELAIDGRKVTLSNLTKVLYPESGFTKAQVIDYYIRISPQLLPHFANRPVTLKRFPDGVHGEAFYEKDEPRFAPEWIETFPVPRRRGGPDIRYILINDLATLVWCANAASLELHPFLHQAPAIQQPTSIVFDLDPGEGMRLGDCAEVACILRELLRKRGLEAFPKVSGSKGLQIYVPLNSGETYEVTQPFARGIAELLAQQHPKLIVAEMAKSQRRNKVFIDWSQNSDFKTTAGVYSLRAKIGTPFVSLPVTWDELESSPDHLRWQPQAALERIAKLGDLFAPLLTLRQSISGAKPVSTRPKRSRPETKNMAQTAKPSKQGSRKRFVIQKHAASHLHFDFRLEMHGVLKSWAVPKGLPYEPDERRLAMATEDHPLAYLDFEGVIPEGQYGGGTVMVWDIGTYEVIEGNYHKGSLRFHLDGKKLKGEWVIAKDRKDETNKWKLSKCEPKQKPLSVKKAATSVISGRTMEQIAEDKNAIWHSNRTELAGLDLDALPIMKMGFVEPMQCKLVGEVPAGPEWQYEVKLDGYRALALKDHGKVALLSRRNHSFTEKYAAIAAAAQKLEDGVILDGEIVAVDESGKPVFNVLQHFKPGRATLIYYAFDILAYRGRDLRGLTLRERRRILDSVINTQDGPVRISPALDAEPPDLIAAVRQQGLEGLIAKRLSSRYESGERTGNWVKFKTNQGQELVVGGYRPGGKHHFDNLAVGYYQDGKLTFIAKLKNGYTPDDKETVFRILQTLATETCPFHNLPETKNARRGEALTAEAMEKYRWVKPELVVQAEFADWTDSNHLRHSKFVGIREDKDPREVCHEQV